MSILSDKSSLYKIFIFCLTCIKSTFVGFMFSDLNQSVLQDKRSLNFVTRIIALFSVFFYLMKHFDIISNEEFLSGNH